MVRRHQLSMSSYDRLFPSQDTLSKGGFGNLIALPLQREARAKGNSVFVDASFSPYADQWALLSNIQRIDSNRVREIVQDAGRRGQVMGLRMVDTEEEPDQTPWKRPPSGYSERMSINETLPRKVHAVISQRLFLERNGLPSPLLNQIKRLAAFQKHLRDWQDRRRYLSDRHAASKHARSRSSEASPRSMGRTTCVVPG